MADEKHPCHNRNPPKMPWFATICRVLPRIFSAAFFHGNPPETQNAANRGKSKP
ncbi:hypothetical protein [Anaeromassilibacillus senegalensis]|uniref:Cyclic lactone autoinducer peptide n=1 Tax=Anaeromassilibacillus senegalensis TaxID=1673717 RepID=A0ABS9CL25_9FIRM|nr:hypothetical protein [Anaeromassilibacillus senegalensis]MCF2651845.1 hypothetical protein [Anaeromassilibacillus senegalensis]